MPLLAITLPQARRPHQPGLVHKIGRWLGPDEADMREEDFHDLNFVNSLKKVLKGATPFYLVSGLGMFGGTSELGACRATQGATHGYAIVDGQTVLVGQTMEIENEVDTIKQDWRIEDYVSPLEMCLELFEIRARYCV